MPDTTLSSQVKLTADSRMTEGLATELDDGTISGHVTIYTGVGSMSISSKDPHVLDELADALRNAASLVYAKQADRIIAETAGDAA